MSRQSEQLFPMSPSSDGSWQGTPTPRRPQVSAPTYVAVQPERAPSNNGFAIAVLVISIVAIIVCILIVFLVKPCPRGRNGRVDIVVDAPPAAAGGAAAAPVVSPSAGTAGAAGDKKSAVVDLTSKAELDKAIARGKSVVIFWASWCGHCKVAVPEYRKAAADMIKACPGLKVLTIDGDKARDALAPNGVKGFPTIKAFLDGKAVGEYSGDRSARSFVDYAKKMCAGAK